MLKLLGQIPYVGDYVVTPLLELGHFTINTVQFILGL